MKHYYTGSGERWWWHDLRGWQWSEKEAIWRVEIIFFWIACGGAGKGRNLGVVLFSLSNGSKHSTLYFRQNDIGVESRVHWEESISVFHLCQAQETLNSQNNFKKEQSCRTHISWFQNILHKAILIKTVWYWHQDK